MGKLKLGKIIKSRDVQGEVIGDSVWFNGWRLIDEGNAYYFERLLATMSPCSEKVEISEDDYLLVRELKEGYLYLCDKYGLYENPSLREARVKSGEDV